MTHRTLNKDGTPDCEGTSEVVCPYCGYTFEASYELFSGRGRRLDEALVECQDEECGKTFKATEEHTVDYTSEKLA